MLSAITAEGSTESGHLIDEIVREGAWRMLAAAPKAEANQGVAELAAERDERGHRLVVRNGHHRPRTVVTAAGPVEVTAPRVNDRRVDEVAGECKRFSSRILASWCRKSLKISEVLPLLYLHGLSSGGFVPALEQFLGGTAGLSAAMVTRLTRQWQDDHAAFQGRDLSDRDFVCVWADGVPPKCTVMDGSPKLEWLTLLGDDQVRSLFVGDPVASWPRLRGRPLNQHGDVMGAAAARLNCALRRGTPESGTKSACQPSGDQDDLVAGHRLRRSRSSLGFLDAHGRAAEAGPGIGAPRVLGFRNKLHRALPRNSAMVGRGAPSGAMPDQIRVGPDCRRSRMIEQRQ